MKRFYSLMMGVAGIALVGAAVVVAEEQAVEQPGATAPLGDQDAVAPGGGCLPGGECCGAAACAKAKAEAAGTEGAADCPCQRMKKAKEAKEKGAS